MSNAIKTYGFVPYGSMDSKGYGGIRAYYIPATDSHAVGIGDVVTRTLGMNASAINGHPAGTLPVAVVNYQDVTTATAITGVVVGLEPINPFDSMAAQGAASQTQYSTYALNLAKQSMLVETAASITLLRPMVAPMLH